MADRRMMITRPCFTMRVKIIGVSYRPWRVIERLAVVLLTFVLLLILASLVVRPSRQKAVSQTAAAVPVPLPMVPEAPVLPPPKATAEAEVPPEPKPERKPVTRKTHEPREPRPPKPPSADGFRLRGGSVIVLAFEESAANELRRQPDQFSKLVQSGALFSVPGNTAVIVEASHPPLAKVRILDGPMQGKSGWVRADRVSER